MARGGTRRIVRESEMDWMLLPLRRYALFTGRARPKEYWMFALFIALATIVLAIVESVLGIGSGESVRTIGDGSLSVYSQHNFGWLTGLFSLAMLVPSLAVGVRRLHDTDRSGWWLLIGLIPLAGGIVLFVFFVMSGTRGPNRFGPDPIETGEGGALR
ncbi:DUF805 domain-containing protein [Sphingomonas profundi]|uniref:DUF805 domain-containing protein n=1 Tax=Alterirhizorhabdus profundi TaxID=2681549 RepID=UPI001E5EF6F4|nr:DUF805 domain-containing protein [Sphingomonas profundi]